MQVILIRHGMTAGNELGRYIGRTDEPLSEKGAAQAGAAGRDPELEAVYVTALRRTGQTARLLFPNARQTVVAGLEEMDFGEFENRSARDMEGDSAYRAWVEGGCLAPCPGGEGRAEFSRRVCRAFAGVVEDAAARGCGRAVFVVHGGTIMAALERFARPRRDFYEYAVKNCRGYRCRVCPPGPSEQLPFVLEDLAVWDGNKT